MNYLNTMKKLFLFFGLIIAAACSNAQTYAPPPAIPPYRILTTDSVYVTPANLKKHKPVMIIYFAPDCSHCRHLMEEMKPKMKEFRNIQVVMVTFVNPEAQFRAIKDFYKDFQLKKYPNFTVGTEGYTYLVQRYYMVKTTPYIAIYDKNFKMTQGYEKPPAIEQLIAAVKKVE
ncbi:MAG: thiol-disulfide oxidoreductase [Mucilaginibacter sp.]|jgi:thiol-disulfide isomerase/thioredoxin|nr:thiol-disulfide oxidoreductase [Mucilaginibacter sp.]